MNLLRAVAIGPRAAATLLALRRGRLAVASINVLNRCNQACPMCSVHEAADDALPLAEVDRALAALRAAGVSLVEISGGEPFLRRDLPDLLALVDRHRLLFTFNTNGTAITEAGLAALARAQGLLQVAVSLDSLDRERYRALRGRDHLALALAGLDRLRAARLAASLKLNFAMSHHNEAETPALLQFARERGLFLSVFPVNQGPGAHRSHRGDSFATTADERERLAVRFDDLARLRRRGEPLWEPSAFYRAAASFLRGRPLAPCGAGALYVDVRADGSIAPCVELPPVTNLDGLAAGTLPAALATARDAVDRCRATTPCCYTCTVNLAETGRHPFAYALEQARVLLGARFRRTPQPLPPRSPRGCLPAARGVEEVRTDRST